MIKDRVQTYEAYKQNKYIFKKLPKSKLCMHGYQNIMKALNLIQNKNACPTYININNIELGDFQYNNPKEYNKRKTKILLKLEELFPYQEFINNFS